MKLIDTNHPFFRPLWVRIAVFAFAAGWATFEFVVGSAIWGAIFLVFAGLSFHGFFIAFDPQVAPPPRSDEDRRGEG
jgi:hypothetical protein